MRHTIPNALHRAAASRACRQMRTLATAKPVLTGQETNNIPRPTPVSLSTDPARKWKRETTAKGTLKRFAPRKVGKRREATRAPIGALQTAGGRVGPEALDEP